jgi:hypothetical protein
MDRVSDSLLNEFSSERGIAHLPEDKRFEHFVSFITVGRHYSDSFDTEDVLVGSATGIDGIAVIVNGILVTDVESLEEMVLSVNWTLHLSSCKRIAGPPSTRPRLAISVLQ